MKTSDSPLLVACDGGILRLTLNRPKQLNALDAEMIRALEASLRAYAADESVRVAILTGDRRSFCFGADLAALPPGAGRTATLQTLLPRFQTMIVRLAHFPVPTIAALGGFATGAGLDLALACDLRI